MQSCLCMKLRYNVQSRLYLKMQYMVQSCQCLKVLYTVQSCLCLKVRYKVHAVMKPVVCPGDRSRILIIVGGYPIFFKRFAKPAILG